jgi:hypothetical protein
MKGTAEQNINLRQLMKMIEEHDDARDAFRTYTGLSLNAIAQSIAMRRSDLNMMLAADSPRRYLHGRRRLEEEYNLPPYSLDDILDQKGVTHGSEG